MNDIFRVEPIGDIEQGMPLEHRLHGHNPNRRLSFTNPCVIGLAFLIVLLKFPIATSLTLFAFLLCASSCLRLIIQHSRRLLGDEALAGFWTQMNIFRIPSDVNLTNLRLTLIDRDFNENDYDMLLALDERTGPSAPERQWTHNALSSLPVTTYEERDGKEEMCTVCLETFRNGDRLRQLPCRHRFHDTCIASWLKQKGTMTTCPICKEPILSLSTHQHS